MNQTKLAIALGAAYCMAAETQTASGGNGNKKPDTRSAGTSEETEKALAKQRDAAIAEVKGIEVMGAEEAEAMIRRDAETRLTQVQLWRKVASFETEAKAKAYRDGFERKCKELAEKGGELAESAASIRRNVSILNRIIRSIYGWNAKIEGTSTVERRFAEGMADMGDDEARREKILGVIDGPGTWSKKLDAIPKAEGMGGRPVATPEVKAGETYRKGTTELANKVGNMGDASALANVMKVPTAVAGKPVPENTRQRLALDGTEAAIKVCPDDKLEIIWDALVSRSLVSSNRVIQQRAIRVRQLIDAEVREAAAAPQVIRTHEVD